MPKIQGPPKSLVLRPGKVSLRRELGREAVVCCLSRVLMVAEVLIGSGDKERNSLALAGYVQRELQTKRLLVYMEK